MSLPIEAYALLSDMRTAALVGNNGSIDWWCVPRFDAPACFAALTGEAKHGRWLLAPSEPILHVQRRYRPASLVLETDMTTASGMVRFTDCLVPEQAHPRLIRRVEGLRGTVPMSMELIIRFYYGSIVPWVRRHGGHLHAIGGPDGLTLETTVPVEGRDMRTVASFGVQAGERLPFVLSWHPPSEPPPPPLDADEAIATTRRFWQQWAQQCSDWGPWRDVVLSSLTVLKGLTYAPTGGIIAAATTSLPEWIGGTRNWDYRYCWLRDATLSLYALMLGGFKTEAAAWRDWLLRAVAGDMSQLQIMYGAAGERKLRESELSWLPGYAHSKPVRIGNAASEQVQLDVYGEVMDTLYQAGRVGIPADPWVWNVQRQLLQYLEHAWQQPDHGIWEVRGPPRHFVHSKVMAWVAFDRAIKSVESFGCRGDVARWRDIRTSIHRQVCDAGFDPQRGTFTQYYGSDALDAALLLIPLVGFLPATDPRVLGTVRAIERELSRDGFVQRYSSSAQGAVDGVDGAEGRFLACSFWLADNYAQQGRHREAETLFTQLLALRNDVGLLAEQYDPTARRQLGNFPQAFSHLCLINTAYNLRAGDGNAAAHRCQSPS